MLCQKCGKNTATFFYEENINGKKKKYVLCAGCAEEMKRSGEFAAHTIDWEPFSFFEEEDQLFSSLFGTKEAGMLPHAKRCPLCGLSFADIRKIGKAGCPLCYTTFREELAPTLYRIHGTAEHRGRRPAVIDRGESAAKKADAKDAKAAGAKTKGEPGEKTRVKATAKAEESTGKDTLAILRDELKQAVEVEDFEKAAQLRDRIRAIEADGAAAGNGREG